MTTAAQTALSCSLLAAALCGQTPVESAHASAREPQSTEHLLGGAATVRDHSPNAFGYPAPKLKRRDRRRFLVGNSFFKQNWIESPASASERDGLGPLFNARSCSACHLRDGRSAPPTSTDRDRHGLLIRIGVRQADAPDAPHPAYGGQIQDIAVQGQQAEARTAIDYAAEAGSYGDGSSFELLRPAYSLRDLGYGELGDDVTLGPRTAPALIGLGLLEAVPVATTAHSLPTRTTATATASPDVCTCSLETRPVPMPPRMRVRSSAASAGRRPSPRCAPTESPRAFVWRHGHHVGAVQPARSAHYLSQRRRSCRIEFDLGWNPRDPTTTKLDKDRRSTARSLAVPAAARRTTTPEVRRRCARSSSRTGLRERATAPSLRDRPRRGGHESSFANVDVPSVHRPPAARPRPGARRRQARRRRTHRANGARPPLWGIGLLETVSGHTRLLHDGRARGIAEAILWHGGEGEHSKQQFRLAPREQREALLAFVRSL